MATGNEESYVPRHSTGPREPFEEPGTSAGETCILDALGGSCDGHADGFDSAQMASLSFLYGEEASATSHPETARGRQRVERDRFGRIQDPAEFTISKYVGVDAVKGGGKRGSSDRSHAAPHPDETRVMSPVSRSTAGAARAVGPMPDASLQPRPRGRGFKARALGIVVALVIAAIAVFLALSFRDAGEVQPDATEPDQAVSMVAGDHRLGDFD